MPFYNLNHAIIGCCSCCHQRFSCFVRSAACVIINESLVPLGRWHPLHFLRCPVVVIVPLLPLVIKKKMKDEFMSCAHWCITELSTLRDES